MERRANVGQKTANETAPDVRAVFRDVGLPFGRCVGSKSRYARANPKHVFVANACVLTKDGLCVWRGDLDLTIKADLLGLADASRALNRKLFVMREPFGNETAIVSRAWFERHAIVSVWHGHIETMPFFQRLHGTLA
jgi:hypothetical protein